MPFLTGVAGAPPDNSGFAGFADAAVGRAIDARIRRLRVKLSEGPVPAPPIKSVRGFGYKIVEEERIASVA